MEYEFWLVRSFSPSTNIRMHGRVEDATLDVQRCEKPTSVVEGLNFCKGDLWQVTENGVNIFQSSEKGERELKFEGIMHGAKEEVEGGNL